MRASDAICTGLQLTNFWQDIAVDWRKDRVYLPQEDLDRFGVTLAQIARSASTIAGARCSRSRRRVRARCCSPGGRWSARCRGASGLELSAVIEGGLLHPRAHRRGRRRRVRAPPGSCAPGTGARWRTMRSFHARTTARTTRPMTPDEYCQQKAAQSGSSFYYSFLFLPPPRRRAITALYAFCREVDDVVDEVPTGRRADQARMVAAGGRPHVQRHAAASGRAGAG